MNFLLLPFFYLTLITQLTDEQLHDLSSLPLVIARCSPESKVKASYYIRNCIYECFHFVADEDGARIAEKAQASGNVR